MAHKTEGDCPIATSIFIRKEAKRRGISINKMVDHYSQEAEIPKGTLDRWVYPRKKSNVSNDVTAKWEKIAKEIRAGNVSDDDAKVVGDALADAISDGKTAPRVATKAATAVKKVMSKNKKPPKYKDDFERLSDYCMSFAEGLQYWADGTIQPETQDQAIDAGTIMDAIPNLIMQFHRLGVNVEEIMEIVRGKRVEFVEETGGEVIEI